MGNWCCLNILCSRGIPRDNTNGLGCTPSGAIPHTSPSDAGYDFMVGRPDARALGFFGYCRQNNMGLMGFYGHGRSRLTVG